MPKDEQTTLDIAKTIERYLSKHGSAADSLENITKWWLSHQQYHEALEDVQKAIDYLVAKGRIERTKSADGADIYRKH